MPVRKIEITIVTIHERCSYFSCLCCSVNITVLLEPAACNNNNNMLIITYCDTCNLLYLHNRRTHRGQQSTQPGTATTCRPTHLYFVGAVLRLEQVVGTCKMLIRTDKCYNAYTVVGTNCDGSALLADAFRLLTTEQFFPRVRGTSSCTRNTFKQIFFSIHQQIYLYNDLCIFLISNPFVFDSY